MQPEITAKSWAMVVILGLIWGGTFPVIELVLVEVTPFWLAAGRILFAAILTTGIWLTMGGRLFAKAAGKGTWTNLVAIGVMSTALPFMLISWGQKFVTAGFAGISMATVALMVLPLAHFIVAGERMTPRKSIGFLIGFVGVVVLIGPGAFAASGNEGELQGRIACLAAAGCYAVSSVTMRRLPAADPVGISAVTLLIGAVFAFITLHEVGMADDWLATGGAAVGAVGLFYGVQYGSRSVLIAGCGAIVVSVWIFGIQHGRSLGAVGALAFTAALLFWASSRLGRDAPGITAEK